MCILNIVFFRRRNPFTDFLENSSMRRFYSKRNRILSKNRLTSVKQSSKRILFLSYYFGTTFTK
ncbi:hypothetical protein CH380_20455 [Leptospira adleri]|uniref:Uncharacterized protein n=1 Tax=Leptospira adleri TaxID=2023186 RepID=A0A2M9YIP1_9LEPT|nr:hypothetical protein CH380_20455 [Leptospira adleri]PJZ60436.1 hypothetical protein CH376_18460 [Leptospira adleri]